jgi:hypothetical protein
VIRGLEFGEKSPLFLVVSSLVGDDQFPEAQQAQGVLQRGEALGGVEDVPGHDQVEGERGPGGREGVAPGRRRTSEQSERVRV